MTTVHRRTARFFERRPLLSVSVAVILAAVTVAARLLMDPLFDGAVPFVFLLPAVLLVAVVAGRRAGAVTLAVGMIGTWIFVMAPDRPDGVFRAADAVVLGAFLLSGGIIIWIAGELRRTLEESTLARRRLQAALAASETGTWYWDVASDVLDWDPPLAAVYGLPHAAAPRKLDGVFALVVEDDRAQVRETLAAALVEGDNVEHEFRIQAPDGSLRWIYDRAHVIRDADRVPVAVVGAAQDVSRRKASEAALRAFASELESRVAREVAAREAAQAALAQSQRMEAIGQLTGGVAHDFNNLLQALAGCLQMIQRRAPDPAVRGFIDAGQQAVERGGRLTQQLMAFARRQALNPEPTDVRNRVLGMSELLSRALRADIDVAIDLSPDLWPIEVDPTQFEVALLNLTVNARDAMPEGGELRIGCRNLPAADGRPDGVEISVSDTGTGMPPDVVARVFDPFYTTKSVGKGSGLGLSQVYGFVTQSSGTVTIRTAVGEGTTVAMVLPRSLAAPQERRPEAMPRTSRRGGRILVVEDDAIVAATVTSVLRDFGFEAVRASSGDEAVATMEAGPAFDLVFSDVVMPGGTSGADLARHVRLRWPGTPVVLTTGYRENIEVPPDVPVIGKPYQVGVLLEALETALARAPSA